MFGRRPLTPIEERLGYRFRRPELLAEALTHRSHANEKGLAAHYERLEFLGDAVLGMLTAEWLFEHHPDLPEGQLSKRKSALVSERNLAPRAVDLGLGAELRLGVGEERSGGRDKPSLLADAVEALLGALWLDGGLEPTRRFVHQLLVSSAQTSDSGPSLLHGDVKTELQELVQGWGWERPAYRVVGETGPDHEKRFTVECRVRGELVGRGTGKSKKTAQKKAAARGLEKLRAEQVESPLP